MPIKPLVAYLYYQDKRSEPIKLILKPEEMTSLVGLTVKQFVEYTIKNGKGEEQTRDSLKCLIDEDPHYAILSNEQFYGVKKGRNGEVKEDLRETTVTQNIIPAITEEYVECNLLEAVVFDHREKYRAFNILKQGNPFDDYELKYVDKDLFVHAYFFLNWVISETMELVYWWHKLDQKLPKLNSEAAAEFIKEEFHKLVRTKFHFDESADFKENIDLIALALTYMGPNNPLRKLSDYVERIYPKNVFDQKWSDKLLKRIIIEVFYNNFINNNPICPSEYRKAPYFRELEPQDKQNYLPLTKEIVNLALNFVDSKKLAQASGIEFSIKEAYDIDLDKVISEAEAIEQFMPIYQNVLLRLKSAIRNDSINIDSEFYRNQNGSQRRT